MNRVNPGRRKEKAEYKLQREAYLAEHPFCQIWIAMHGLREEDVIAVNGHYIKDGVRKAVPRATEIHHRNKSRGSRLTDERFWMAACRELHDQVERTLDVSRDQGYLLPIQADEDGRWGDGNQALETPAFMKSKERPKPEETHDDDERTAGASGLEDGERSA